jgi:hypothetical protein
MAKQNGSTPSAAAPPVIRVAPMDFNRNNEVFFGYLVRRLRELLLEAQQRRADGGIQISMSLTGGNLGNSITIQPRYTESVSGAGRESS